MKFLPATAFLTFGFCLLSLCGCKEPLKTVDTDLPETVITEAVTIPAPQQDDLKPPLDVLPQPPERADVDSVEAFKGQSVPEIILQLVTERKTQDDPFANAERAEWFNQKRLNLPADDITGQDQLRIKVAHEKIRAGSYDNAAIDLTEWLGSATPPDDLATLSPDQRTGWQLLATAELRRAMSAISANAEPLILASPPEDMLEEVDRESLTTAEGIFRAFAEENDSASESRWLLNLAAIVGNSYPDSVPAALQIPDLLEKKTELFPEFNRTFLNDMGHATSLCWTSVTEGTPDLIRLGADDIRVFEGGGEIELTDSLGLTDVLGGVHVSTADIDNDGTQEILILRDGPLPNSLLKRGVDGLFADVTEAVGLLAFLQSRSAAWADFDQDGQIDLVLANGSAPLTLYRNLGDGTFEDVTWLAGIDGRPATHVEWADLDGDGWSDLIVSPEGSSLEIWRGVPSETPEDWRFADVAIALEIEAIGGGPIWTWDFDNDGALDLGCVSDEKIKIFRNDGDGFTFTDITGDLDLDLAVGETGTATVGDIDSDGFPDLFLGTGGSTPAALGPNRLFWNRGGDRFREISAAGGFGLLEKSPSAVFADLGDDGDLDLVVGMGSRYESDSIPPVFFDNPGNFGNRFLKVTLNPPTDAARDGIGTRLHVTVRDEDWILNEIHVLVKRSGPVFIGLGRAKKIETLAIQWPVPGATYTEMMVPPVPNSSTILPASGE